MQEDRTPNSSSHIRAASPSYPNPQHVAQSAKVKRKGVQKTQLETNMPQSSDKMHQSKNNVSSDPMTTPKLHQFQEIHKTTILEENETMRGSIDRYPGSKLSMHPGGSQSNVKKYNRVD